MHMTDVTDPDALEQMNTTYALGEWADKYYRTVRRALIAEENDWRLQLERMNEARSYSVEAYQIAHQSHRHVQRARTELENLYNGLPAGAS